MKNYNGVIDELINGTWLSPSDQNQYGIPIKNIQILESVGRFGVRFDQQTS
jgi:hypothetical protein